jgi:hypothetical protein
MKQMQIGAADSAELYVNLHLAGAGGHGHAGADSKSLVAFKECRSHGFELSGLNRAARF